HSPLYQEMHALLDNCRGVTGKLQVTYLSPELEEERFSALVKRFPALGGGRGVLIAYGEGGANREPPSAFIAQNNLYSISPGKDQNRPKQVYKFQGEEALMRELSQLIGGKEKPVIYFTQGNGELSLNNPDPTVGMSQLKTRLERDNFEVKAFRLGKPG